MAWWPSVRPSGKTAGYWPSSFLFVCVLRFYGPRRSRGPQKHAKKNGANIEPPGPNWSSQQRFSVLYGINNIFFLRDIARNPQRARSRHRARSGSQSQPRIWFVLPTQRASHLISQSISLWWLDAREAKTEKLLIHRGLSDRIYRLSYEAKTWVGRI